MSSGERRKKKLSVFFRIPLLLGLFLAVITVLIYFIDWRVGVILTVYLGIYFIFTLYMYLNNSEILRKEMIAFATNYDQMFEQVLEERGVQAPIYNSPALPLGSDVNGIIHIHGNVSNPKYMVVTDEDFGRAYLTEGYATRFLVSLFESYTVLFIGYSYSDTILRYLTRAMSRQHSANRYILTDDTKSDWNALGISSINYPKRSFIWI